MCRPITQFFGQTNRSFEVRERLIVGEPAERSVACLAPPFDCGLLEPCPSEMVRDDLWLAFGDRREAVPQRLADASMQNLSPALEKTLIRRVLHQGMLEAVDCLRRDTASGRQLGLFEFGERHLQRSLVERGRCGKLPQHDRPHKL